MTENHQRWLRTLIDVGSLLALLFAGFIYLDTRFDALENAMGDRWTGAHMMSWVAGAERAHEDAVNPKDVKLPNPYDIRRQHQERQ